MHRLNLNVWAYCLDLTIGLMLQKVIVETVNLSLIPIFKKPLFLPLLACSV